MAQLNASVELIHDHTVYWTRDIYKISLIEPRLELDTWPTTPLIRHPASHSTLSSNADYSLIESSVKYMVDGITRHNLHFAGELSHVHLCPKWLSLSNFFMSVMKPQSEDISIKWGEISVSINIRQFKKTTKPLHMTLCKFNKSLKYAS